MRNKEHCLNVAKYPFCSCLLLSADSRNISARVGITVVLPCEFNATSVHGLYVRWYIHSEVVFERVGKDSYEGEGYEGRVDVPEDELCKGNCSLVLKNVSVADAGHYRSYLKRFIQSVELSVDGKSP